MHRGSDLLIELGHSVKNCEVGLIVYERCADPEIFILFIYLLI